MGFLHWVGGFVKSIPHDIAKVLRAAAHMVTVVWNLLHALGVLVHRAWVTFAGGVEAFAGDVANLAHSTYTALSRILLHTIPAAVRGVLAAAGRDARRLVGDVRSWAEAAITAAVRFAQQVADDVRSWAADALHLLSRELSGLADDVAHILDKLQPILGGPATLAQWLAGEMWRALFRLFRSQEKAIAAWLFRHAKALALAAAADIEAVIAELF